jgi:hypothetical protein
MTMAALSPLRKQGDVSKDSTAPTAVLPQGSNAPSTATTSHEQGAKTSPAATTACTQGSSSSLLDTLAHYYISYCTPGPSPYAYKRKVQGSRTGGWPRGRTGRRVGLSLSLSPTRTLVTPYCKRTRPGRRTTRRPRVFPFCLSPFPLHAPSCADPSGLEHAATIYSSVQGPPRGRNADNGARTQGKDEQRQVEQERHGGGKLRRLTSRPNPLSLSLALLRRL